MDAFQESAISDIKAYHGLILDITRDERIPVDVRLEIALKVKAILTGSQSKVAP